VPPKQQRKNPAAAALGRQRMKKLSAPEIKELGSKGGKSAWAGLGPEARSAEMKRRARLRLSKKIGTGKKKRGAG
jgi:hypothetical protein